MADLIDFIEGHRAQGMLTGGPIELTEQPTWSAWERVTVPTTLPRRS